MKSDNDLEIFLQLKIRLIGEEKYYKVTDMIGLSDEDRKLCIDDGRWVNYMDIESIQSGL